MSYTVQDAIELINDKHLHPNDYHLSMHRMDLLPEMMAYSDTPHRIMQQSYDWRYGRPGRDRYTLTLSDEDMEYLGKAIELFHETLADLYIRPHLEDMLRSI